MRMRNMERLFVPVLCFALLMAVSSCAGLTRPESCAEESSTAAVEPDPAGATEPEIEIPAAEAPTPEAEMPVPEETAAPPQEVPPDYDLASMNATMAAAQLQDIMLHSGDYVDAVVRVAGQMRVSTNPDTGQLHTAVYIMDAAGCCALLGIEFCCGGDAVWPEDYPAQDTIVTVTGRLTATPGERLPLLCLDEAVITA